VLYSFSTVYKDDVLSLFLRPLHILWASLYFQPLCEYMCCARLVAHIRWLPGNGIFNTVQKKFALNANFTSDVKTGILHRAKDNLMIKLSASVRNNKYRTVVLLSSEAGEKIHFCFKFGSKTSLEP
jgi:hypothetical protein